MLPGRAGAVLMRFISSDQQDVLRNAFQAGLSIRSAARFAGVAKGTAQRYFRMMPPLLCPCGRELPHKSWCTYRVALSPRRQEVLMRLCQGGVKDETMARWLRLRDDVLSAVSGGRWLATIDAAGMSELRRFYDPSASWGFEYARDTVRIVAVADATQETTALSYDLFAALDTLPDPVKRFCVAIIEGASVREAADESRLSDDDLARELPPLREFLRPYLLPN